MPLREDLIESVKKPIEEIRVYYARIQYYAPFVIATATITYADIALVLVRAGDVWGVGEGYLSRDDATKLAEYARSLLGLRPAEALSRLEKFKLPLEMALLDLCARYTGVKFGELFSDMKTDRILTDVTIGIAPVEKTVEELERALKMGFKAIKLKVGRNFAEDKERVRRVCERLPKDTTLRIDVNQGYTYPVALEFLKFVEEVADEFGVRVEFIEQPLPKDALEDIGRLRRFSPFPIILDESVRVAADVDKVANYCDGVNLKLVKAGSVLEFARAAERARELGLKLMVGCSNETNVGISCAAHLAVAYQFDFADLDSDLFKPDIVRERATKCESSMRIVQGPGLGIEVGELLLDKLERLL